jgi:heptaprenyl diphosphate synthase
MQAGQLTQKALHEIQSRGESALQQACKLIFESQYDKGAICEALHFYASDVLPGVLPIFPALIHLSSRAVGKSLSNTDSVAAAMLLITASGDIHDDIVDNSKGKFGKKTVVGKYGKQTALLAGDLLLTQGFTTLLDAYKNLPAARQSEIMYSVHSAMVEIVAAEALESTLWRKKLVMHSEFFEVFRLKAGVAELHCRIGGLLAGADPERLTALAGCGRVIGVLATLKEEYVDLSNPYELRHRLNHELPPYPLLCAMQDKQLKPKIDRIINKDRMQCSDVSELSGLVLGCPEVKRVEAELRTLGERELATNSVLKCGCCGDLVLLLEALSSELSLI